jgi:hypothetical protein
MTGVNDVCGSASYMCIQSRRRVESSVISRFTKHPSYFIIRSTCIYLRDEPIAAISRRFGLARQEPTPESRDGFPWHSEEKRSSISLRDSRFSRLVNGRGLSMRRDVSKPTSAGSECWNVQASPMVLITNLSSVQRYVRPHTRRNYRCSQERLQVRILPCGLGP